MEKNNASNRKFPRPGNAYFNIASYSQDPDYDSLTFLTATVCDVPFALFTRTDLDNFWNKSLYGIDEENAVKLESFLQEILNSGKTLFSINFEENPDLFKNTKLNLNNDIKFYAGAVLKNDENIILGVLSIWDTRERILDDTHIKAFKALANQFLKLIEYEKQNYQFQQIQNKLKQKYEDLEKFASLVSHDIKSPLANIISLTELLKDENRGKLNEESIQYLDYLVESSYSLRNYVDGILAFYRSDHILEKDYENVDLHQILKGIAKLYEVSNDVIINYPKSAVLHNVNKAALSQVFLNVISNGLKYNKKKIRKIEIQFEEERYFYRFKVIDNGEGFPEEESAKIFELFATLDATDREGNPGTGIGLATVEKLVINMGGSIDVKSTPGEGSTFSFTVRRH